MKRFLYSLAATIVSVALATAFFYLLELAQGILPFALAILFALIIILFCWFYFVLFKWN